jgi:hypothetical protein
MDGETGRGDSRKQMNEGLLILESQDLTVLRGRANEKQVDLCPAGP